jgi:hypothetical protein
VGSLRESVLLMLIIHKDRIEHAATRLLTQSQINPEAGPKAFDEYVKIRYPYLETSKKNEKDTAVARMLSEIQKGPLSIRPMSDTSIKSKTYKKIARADHENATAVASRLMSKIGRVMPT